MKKKTSEKHRRNIGETSEKHGIVELNSTQQEIVKLLLENNQLSAAKLAEKIGVASRNIESNIKKSRMKADLWFLIQICQVVLLVART